MLEILLPINRNQNDKKILWALRDSPPALPVEGSWQGTLFEK
jgi:hypothetical protein